MNLIKRTSIADSFETPKTAKEEPREKEEPRDRAAGLVGLIPPRPATSRPVVHVPTSPMVIEPAAAPVVPAEPTPVKNSTVVPSAGGGGVATIGVYLAPATLERAREATQHRRITYTDLLVEAFDNVTDAQLVAEFAPVAPLVQGKAMPTRSRRRMGAAGIQMNLRLSREQREWLDTKVLALGAPSRSALVAETLRLHLNSPL